MVKEDPLHRLSRTPTKAFTQQKWEVWKEAERERTRPIKEWGKSPPPKTSPDKAFHGPPTKGTPKKQSSPQTKVSKQETLSSKHHYQSTKTSKTGAAEKSKPIVKGKAEAKAVANGSSTGAKQSSFVSRKKAPPPPLASPPEPLPETIRKIAIPDKVEAMKLFDQLDENASGKLSLAEIDKGIVTLFPDWNNKPAIMAAYKAADRSGNGFVERKEYGYLLPYMVYYNNLWNLFATIDDDGDRRISLDEFMAAASKLDLPRNAQDVFAEIDVNGGGMILFNELVHWMAIHKSTWGTEDADMGEVQQKLEATTVDKEMEMPTTLAPPPPPEPVPQVVMQIDIPDKETGMKLFDQLDENASGKLSLAELDKGIVTLFPDWNNKPAIMAAYKAADRSGNGFVERNEFGYFLRYIVYYNNLWSLFASMDDNGDRRITKQEFTAAAGKLNLPRDAQDVFDEIDENKGGMILFDELVHWMATWGSE